MFQASHGLFTTEHASDVGEAEREKPYARTSSPPPPPYYLLLLHERCIQFVVVLIL